MLIVQSLIDGEVAQVKEEVAHTGVLPVKNPDVVSIINEVAREQIIMTWYGVMEWSDAVFDLLHQGKHLGQGVGKDRAVFKGQLVVVAHGRKR